MIGEFKAGEPIYNSFGSQADVFVEGQPQLRLTVAGTSDTIGDFVDDSSKVSTQFAVIQDSEYFQRFSYEIQSPLQQVQYETFVQDIVHPTGFAMFSSVIINSHVVSGSSSEGATLTIQDGGPDTEPVWLSVLTVWTTPTISRVLPASRLSRAWVLTVLKKRYK